jgi:hypothetical protein
MPRWRPWKRSFSIDAPQQYPKNGAAQRIGEVNDVNTWCAVEQNGEEKHSTPAIAVVMRVFSRLASEASGLNTLW